MKKSFIYFGCFLLMSMSSYAQNPGPEDWQVKPVLHTVPAEFAGEPAVLIEHNAKVRYSDEPDNSLWVYKTNHRIIKVLDEKGIESFNKMTVSIVPGEEMQTLKARTILPNGTINEVAKEKMKVMKGDDGNDEIVFAMDGVEKNAELELLIYYKKPAVLFGRETFQFMIPVVHATFELTAPSRLKFEEKGYNGFPTVSDTLIDSTRHIYVHKENIPGIQKEEYSFQDANRMKAEYKVSYLPEKKEQVRMFTWQELAQRLFSNTYSITEKESKAVEKYLSSLGVTSNNTEEEKIKKIENGIKSGIVIDKELNDEESGKLENVISKKAASENSMIRLFAACFRQSGVNSEFGMTTNRSNNVFDPEFENWNNMEEYLFYFPNSKKFISPASIYIRYPFTSTDVLGNKGIFCKLTTLGEITSAMADIRFISARPVAESQSNILADITFNSDMEASAEAIYSFSGYCAMGIRELALLLSKDKLKDMVQSIIQLADKPENLVKYTITGDAFENYYTNKPLQFVATVKISQLVEKAGPKYIFRLGDVIGRQSELYQSTERKMAVDLQYPHTLNRTITMVIPEGYKILNPETIKMSTEFKDESGTVTTAFYSDYKIESNKLTVNISEFYSQLHFSVSEYEPFRKVINSSADFNKVNLVMGKL